MEFPALNVFHSRDTLLKPSYCRNLKCNRVLLCDESHYGAVEDGLIDNLLKEWNSPLKVGKEVMDKYNVYTLLISATPFAEISTNVGPKMTMTLPLSVDYYGLWHMFKAKRIFDNRKFEGLEVNATTETIKKMVNKLFIKMGKGFVFIRENVKSKASMAWPISMGREFLFPLFCLSVVRGRLHSSVVANIKMEAKAFKQNNKKY